ncbi:MAG: hypothetical protein PF542_00720 [Nanoarchaeota archaeon]|jgi:hypothetical protein|nr:hypothetical protein [Nanoarchaeota archaeon]
MKTLEFENHKDFWRINNLQYRGKASALDIKKDLIDERKIDKKYAGIAYLDISTWINEMKKSKERGNFYTGDLPLHNALFTSVFELKQTNKDEKEIRKLKDILATIISDDRLLTNSTTRYNAKGEGQIIHNKWMNDEYIEHHNLVGSNDHIATSPDSKLYKKLLGTDNLKNIDQIYGKEVSFTKFNQRPYSDECPLEFFMIFERFSINGLYITPSPPMFFDHPSKSYGRVKSLGLRLNEINLSQTNQSPESQKDKQ